ncbi:MAG: hypothetical protein K5905_26260 [Roseibium sp.]|uniref:hypothetical protein n=1 Tax=Roseibium sp. TaxID=1936156 RepID=UPI002615CEE5|nr:hypothetical protein [Roseibium sp.]MCV0428973.1 hypothetical protein [Roseibium sp.]
MSIFSILQSSSRQQFDLRNRTDTQKEHTGLSTAESLAQAISASDANGSEDDDAALSLFEDYKEAVELSSGLSRSIESGQDAMRQERIKRIEQRIEQLKELLKFASPEQAKRLMRELKQISKEFKTASQELNKAGQDKAFGGIGAVTSNSVNTVAAVIEAASSSPVASGSPGLTSAVETSTVSIEAETVASPLPENSSSSVATKDDAANTEVQSRYGESPSIDPADSTGQSTADETGFNLISAVQAYAERLEDSDDAHRLGRRARMQSEHEELGKIAAEIKYLAARLEQLAERDDEEAEKDLKDLRGDLEDGLKELDDPGLKNALGLGSGSSIISTGIPTASGTLSASAVSTGILA